MRLALISPKSVFFSCNSDLSNFFRNTFTGSANGIMMSRYAYWTGGNLGLLILSALTPSEYEIDYIDENYETINFEESYDIVGISAMTQQAPRAYEIADIFRNKGIKVVIGGIHATLLPEEAAKHADSVVVGEAEDLWPELIQDCAIGKLKRFYYSTKPVDLARSPVPRYDLLKKYDYKMLWIQTARGCPRDCEFCAASNVYGKGYRHKTIDQVISEINFIKSHWQRPLLNFTDDNMFVDKKYSKALIEAVAKTKLRWTAQGDISVAEDDAFLDFLQRSNCVLLFIGLETLTPQDHLDRAGWKQKKIEKYPELIRRIQARGIGVLGAFIVGLDNDDASVFEKVASFVIENRLYATQISVPTPLPGTRLRERLMKEGRILTDDWARYTFGDVNFIPKKMKPDELQDGLLYVYNRVYNKKVRLEVMRQIMDVFSHRNGNV